MRSSDPLVSIVAPVYNEEEGISEFYHRVVMVLDGIELKPRYEIIFVDDGSTDSSIEFLRQFAEHDPRVKIIALSRNFGHQIAITAGIDHAKGDAVVLIDADLQDPPEVIDRMLDSWQDGSDVVYGVRTRRMGERGSKLVTARLFYRLINHLSDVPLPLDSGDFRLMDRRVVEALAQIREENRYLRGLVSWVGFKQNSVEYERDSRFAGSSKFSLNKMLRFAADGITSFSERPLRLALQLGGGVTLLTLLFGAWIMLDQLLRPGRTIPGYASLMVVILFLSGIQLLSIGLLGEYVGRIYRESKRRPLYFVSEYKNIEGRVGPRPE